jgi:uncharacterized membrane protein
MPHFQHLFQGSPAWLLALATAALVLHIGGGTVGMVTGAGALAFRKGESLHRLFGKVFIIAMLVNAVMATSLASVLVSRGVTAQWSNVFGGFATFYLVSTAWVTARRAPGTIGRFEYVALAISLASAAFALLGLVKLAHGGKTDNGVPVAAPIVFALVAVLAAGLDLKVVVRGGIAGAARIARHLWRMCAGLFIASGSFFIGQQQVMPTFVQGSPILLVLGFAPLPLLVFWLLRVRFTKAYRAEPATA